MSGLAPFFDWWLQELRDCLEAALRYLAPRLVTRALVRISAGGVSISIARGKEERLALEMPYPANGELPPELPTLAPGDELRGMRAIAVLARDQVLVQELILPRIVERDLDRALQLHLERHGPLRRDLTYAARQIVARDRAKRQIVVQLLLARTRSVDRWRERLAGWGLTVARIAVADSTGRIVGDFLPRRASTVSLRLTPLDRWLAGCAVAVVALALCTIGGQWIYERVQVEREVGSAVALAAEADSLNRELDAQSRPALALTAIAARPDALDALASLSARVPLDSWAYDVRIAARADGPPDVQLSAFAPTGAKLVDLIENTPEFEQVRLVSTTSAGVATQQDRLELVAKGASP